MDFLLQHCLLSGSGRMKTTTGKIIIFSSSFLFSSSLSRQQQQREFRNNNNFNLRKRFLVTTTTITTTTMGTNQVNNSIINHCDNSKNNKSEIIKLAQYFNNFYFKLQSNRNNLKSLLATPLITKKKEIIGLIPPVVKEKILKEEEGNIFKCHEDRIEITIDDYEGRSEALAELLQRWRVNKDFLTLNGWRGERFEIKSDGCYSGDNSDNSLFEMERSATCLFGLRQFGVDINGYVRDPEKGLCVWLQKRADNKQTWPGCLDNMVGGGLSVGFNVLETALKEASEEAGIEPGYLQKHLRPAGSVSFFFESERGLFPNTEFVFDLELPLDFVPQNQDGEVESFSLVTANDALTACLSPAFKTTSCPVTLDFLVRHGVVSVVNEPNLPELQSLLHINLKEIYNNLLLVNNEESHVTSS